MRFSFSRTGATAVLVFLLITTAGCTLVNKVRAKNELNEAARSYRDGRFDDAEQHARRALALDESNKTAPIFIARIIHQQYKPGVDQPENIQKAREAIDAYQRVLESHPGKQQEDEAYKAISVLLAAIKDDAKLRDWIMKRANDPSQSNESRAEAYAILAGKDWDCSYKVTELPDVKITSTEGGNAKVTYKKPNQKDFDNIQKCVARGQEEAETAIKLDPNSESGWSYKANLLIERAKIADMNGDTAQKTELEKQSQVAAKRAAALAEEKRKQEAAAETASSPTP
jgi:hypothetical protein